jgi:hypothetical protein
MSTVCCCRRYLAHLRACISYLLPALPSSQGTGVANAPYTVSFSTGKVYNGGTGALASALRCQCLLPPVCAVQRTARLAPDSALWCAAEV